MRALIAGALVLVATTAGAYEQQIRVIATMLGERLTAAERRTVAVVDFTDLHGDTTELGRFLAEELSVALAVGGGSFSVIDRTHLRAILQEHKLAATGIIDPKTARQLGKIAGVDALVTGTLTAFGDSVRLSVKTLDTETAAMLAATTSDIPKTKAVEELLARSVGEAAPRAAPVVPATAPARAAAAGVFQNDFLRVAVDSVGFSEQRGQQRLSVALTFENVSSSDQLLAYVINSMDVSEPLARSWSRDSLSGLPSLYLHQKEDSPSFVRVAAGSRHTVVMNFSTHSELSRPAFVTFSMMCYRFRDGRAEQFSIGIPRIPIDQ